MINYVQRADPKGAEEDRASESIEALAPCIGKRDSHTEASCLKVRSIKSNKQTRIDSIAIAIVIGCK